MNESVCVGDGNPHVMAAMYAAVATDTAGAGHVGIIRPAVKLSSHGGVELVNLLRTDTDPKWINSQSTSHWQGRRHGVDSGASPGQKMWGGHAWRARRA